MAEFSEMIGEEELDLNRLMDQFVKINGRRPTKAEVRQNHKWQALWVRRREIILKSAQPPIEGQCRYFVWRKRRYCIKQAQGDFCSSHVEVMSRSSHARASGEGDSSDAIQSPNQAYKKSFGLIGSSCGIVGLVVLYFIRPRRSSYVLGSLALFGVVRGLTILGSRPLRGGASRYIPNNYPTCQKVGRMRRMLNPASFRTPIVKPKWCEVYSDVSRPLLLDIGCARGGFLLKLASRDVLRKQGCGYNYLGIELFKPLVEAANRTKTNLNLGNLHYLSGNASISLRGLEIPGLDIVCIQFPDPWGHKNRKRRLASPKFAQEVGRVVKSGGQVYICSDWAQLAIELVTLFLQTKQFTKETRLCADVLEGKGAVSNIYPEGGKSCDVGTKRLPFQNFGITGLFKKDCKGYEENVSIEKTALKPKDGSDSYEWLEKSPFPAQTERDKVCEVTWRPVFRYLLRRV